MRALGVMQDNMVVHGIVWYQVGLHDQDRYYRIIHCQDSRPSQHASSSSGAQTALRVTVIYEQVELSREVHVVVSRGLADIYVKRTATRLVDTHGVRSRTGQKQQRQNRKRLDRLQQEA